MPGRDGTGPMGHGSNTGRGLGLCTRSGARASGGRGMRKGCSCGYGLGTAGRAGQAQRGKFLAESVKESLQEQKAALQRRIEAIDKHLDSI